MFARIGSVSFLAEYSPASAEPLAKAFTPREGHGVSIVFLVQHGSKVTL